jgi:hypothetical protein
LDKPEAPSTRNIHLGGLTTVKNSFNESRVMCDAILNLLCRIGRVWLRGE